MSLTIIACSALCMSDLGTVAAFDVIDDMWCVR